MNRNIDKVLTERFPEAVRRLCEIITETENGIKGISKGTLQKVLEYMPIYEKEHDDAETKKLMADARKAIDDYMLVQHLLGKWK